MLKEKLISLGFTPNQADVYLTLIELGQTKVGPLLVKTSFHRNIIYRALEDLIAKKLVAKINKHGVAYFYPVDPKPILEDLERKKEVAKDVIKELKNKTQISHSEVLVLSGHQGVIDLCEMTIKENDDLYLIGATYDILKTHGDYVLKYNERFFKKGLKRYVLARAEHEGKDYITQFGETKFLPLSFSKSPLVIWVFSDVTAHVLWEESQTIFIIRNKKIAQDYRDYFKLLWNQDSWILRGKEGLIELLDLILKVNKNLYYLNATGVVFNYYPDEYQEWIKKFNTPKRREHLLIPKNIVKQMENTIVTASPLRRVRKLTMPVSSPTVAWIFADYVAHAVWQKEKEPTIFLTKNPEVAKLQKQYFDYLWKSGSMEIK